MRIDKLLTNMGYGSRKEVKKFIKQGAVIVNGELVHNPGSHVDPKKDRIFVFGDEVIYREFVYFMMNKPQGFLSATEDSMQPTVVDLLHVEDKHFQPFPVGRLDKDTTGLLLLTNDGKLAHNLLSPKKEVKKTYFAVINDTVDDRDVESFLEGITLDDGYRTKPATLTIINSLPSQSEVLVEITEGKYHQIKRMFRAMGKEVVSLRRIAMGPLRLDENLEEGEYRELTGEELNLLQPFRS